MKKFSVDELLRERPNTIGDLRCYPVEGKKYSVTVNGVDIFANRYEIVYPGTSGNFVILQFYDYNNKHVASISAFGSNEVKEDECFYLIDDNEIVSETKFRVIKNLITE